MPADLVIDNFFLETRMKFLHWKIQLGLALIGASAGLYALNYLIFRDTNYMFRLFFKTAWRAVPALQLGHLRQSQS